MPAVREISIVMAKLLKPGLSVDFFWTEIIYKTHRILNTSFIKAKLEKSTLTCRLDLEKYQSLWIYYTLYAILYVFTDNTYEKIQFLDYWFG